MKSRLLDFLGTTEARLAAAPPARVPFDRGSPAAFLPGPAVSSWKIVRSLGLRVALRVPVMRQFVNAAVWLRSRRRSRKALNLELATAPLARKLREQVDQIRQELRVTETLARMEERGGSEEIRETAEQETLETSSRPQTKLTRCWPRTLKTCSDATIRCSRASSARFP